MNLQKPISIGTCAWSCDDWRGVFYPEKLPAAQRLAFYAQHFPAVEIDSTFYAAPSARVAAHWMESTPEHFVVTCKLPREITHVRRLRNCEELLGEFLDSLAPLRSKLACVLIQLPPHFQPRNDELALREFIRALPSGFRFAIEFRDEGWHAPHVSHLLAEHRICWVWSDLTPLGHRNEGAFNFEPHTTDFLYVRLMGDVSTKHASAGKEFTFRELLWPRTASIESWAVKIQQALETVPQALIFASNCFEGFAPQTCARLARRLGVAIELPQPEGAAGRPHAEQLDFPL